MKERRAAELEEQHERREREEREMFERERAKEQKLKVIPYHIC